jgi:hypothetical protein
MCDTYWIQKWFCSLKFIGQRLNTWPLIFRMKTSLPISGIPVRDLINHLMRDIERHTQQQQNVILSDLYYGTLASLCYEGQA